MVKNEHLYIKEWVDYHLGLGFNDIFIFEDSGSESHEDILKDYDNVHLYKIDDIDDEDLLMKKGSVECQISLMNWFLNKLKEEMNYDWCLFIDVDEFLCLDNNVDMQDLLMEYIEYSGIFLSWKVYDANGFINRPKGNVMDNYTHQVNVFIDGDEDHTMFSKKSFVNLSIAKKFKNNHCITDGVDIEKVYDYNNKLIHHTAWINHYFTKSWEDFCYRMSIRGNMSNNNRNYDQFFKINQDLIFLKKELIFKQRYVHNKDTHYISKEYKLVSGGNLADIKYLNNI